MSAARAVWSGLIRLCAAALLAATVAPPVARAQQPVVTTPFGAYRGLVLRDVRAFRGIRYAASPAGLRRWQPPVPAAAHDGIADALRFAAHCPQAASFFGLASDTEDCLFLNVYAPDSVAGVLPRRLPVLVWIHGGALVVGESDDFVPLRMVRRAGVVVVTINYRLGALGYLAQAALDHEGHEAANYGLMDQQAALRWVQANIAAFGGDPRRVTVFGQSAGGLSTLSILASPTAAGLFQRAIAESGAYSLTLPSLAAAEQQGSAFATAIGCADQSAACLRAAPLAAILAHESQNIVPVVDGRVLAQSLGDAFAGGAFNRVPVIEGSTRNEYRLFVGEDFDILGSGPITAAQYPGLLDAYFGAAGPAVLAQYPLSRYASPDLAFAAPTTDSFFSCPARIAAQAIAQYVPLWSYEFDDRNAPQNFLPPASFPYGAYHESEVQFLMQVRSRPGTPPLSEAEQRLSDRMIDYWTNFARAGSPNGAAVPAWPRYAAAAEQVQALAPSGIGPQGKFAIAHHCAFWAAP